MKDSLLLFRANQSKLEQQQKINSTRSRSGAATSPHTTHAFAVSRTTTFDTKPALDMAPKTARKASTPPNPHTRPWSSRALGVCSQLAPSYSVGFCRRRRRQRGAAQRDDTTRPARRRRRSSNTPRSLRAAVGARRALPTPERLAPA